MSYPRKYLEQDAKRLTQAAATKRLYRRRRALMYSLKLAQGCTDCGYNERPEALEWDHLPGTEKKDSRASCPANMWGSKLENFLAEIAKCEVVCSNCHRIRTVERNALNIEVPQRQSPEEALRYLIENWIDPELPKVFTCNWCGKDVPPSKGGRASIAKFCSSTCRVKDFYDRKDTPVGCTCAECGCAFERRKGGNTYCSSKCRNARNLRIARDKRKT